MSESIYLCGKCGKFETAEHNALEDCGTTARTPTAEERGRSLCMYFIGGPTHATDCNGCLHAADAFRAAEAAAEERGRVWGESSPRVESNAKALADALSDATDCSDEKCPGAISTQDVQRISAGFLQAALEEGEKKGRADVWEEAAQVLLVIFEISSIQDAAEYYRSWSPTERAAWDWLRARASEEKA